MVKKITETIMGYDNLTQSTRVSPNYEAFIAGAGTSIGIEGIANGNVEVAIVGGVTAILSGLSSLEEYKKIWNSYVEVSNHVKMMAGTAMISGVFAGDAIYRAASGGNLKGAVLEGLFAGGAIVINYFQNIAIHDEVRIIKESK